MSGKAARPSFLEDVLTTADQVEMTDLKERIGDVIRNTTHLKGRLLEYMKLMYIDFDPLMINDKKFVDQATQISQEMEELFSRIEMQTKCDLINSTGELRSLHDSLKEATIMLDLTTNLANIDKNLRKAEKAQENNNFLESASCLNNAQELVKNAPKNAEMLDMYKSLKIMVCELWTSLSHKLHEIISNHISWDEIVVQHGVKRCTVKVQTKNFDELEQVVKGLHITDQLQAWLRRFRNFLMRSILVPLVQHTASIGFVDDEKWTTLEVEVHINSGKPDYSTVLNNLTKCFEFLHGELDINLDEQNSFLGALGMGASEEFCAILISDCLRDTVPSSSAELKNFSEVVERMEKFQRYISGIGFLPDDNITLTDYVLNVDVLCANKTCEVHLEKARNIMKKDLHEMVIVGPVKATEQLSVALCQGVTHPTKEEETITLTLQTTQSEQITFRPDSQLNQDTFQFPKCCISKSTLELLELVHNVLEEAMQSKDSCAMRIFYTARNIFELYMAIVPMYHAKFLSTIPQQVALFHNNCMFLAHRLLVLGYELEGRLHPIVQSESTPPHTSPKLITFVDLVQNLRLLGTDTFLKHMQYQRKQILQIIKESGLATLGEDPKLSSDTEKSVRQCLRQLELLQTVWQGILPSNVYSKAIGCLLNAFVEELIVRVSTVEDIPADTATHLVVLFKTVFNRAPKLFKDESEVLIHTKQWKRFQELIKILGASLRDIEEGWGDGKGPLAREFSIEQLKQLTRALFQNTKRRAEVLAKIK